VHRPGRQRASDTVRVIDGVSLKNWRRTISRTAHISGESAGAPGAGVANDARTAVTTLDVVAMKVVPTLRSAAIGSVAAGAVGWVTDVTAAIRTESRCVPV